MVLVRWNRNHVASEYCLYDFSQGNYLFIQSWRSYEQNYREYDSTYWKKLETIFVIRILTRP